MIRAMEQPDIKEAADKFSEAMHHCTAEFHAVLLGTEISTAAQHGLITYITAAYYATVCWKLNVPRKLATNQFVALFDGIGEEPR